MQQLQQQQQNQMAGMNRPSAALAALPNNMQLGEGSSGMNMTPQQLQQLQHQQRNSGGFMGAGNNPVSPVQHQSMSQFAGNSGGMQGMSNMMGGGGGGQGSGGGMNMGMGGVGSMDPRMMSGNMNNMSGGGMSMGNGGQANISAQQHQRQIMLMQQQRQVSNMGMGMAPGGGPTGMNPGAGGGGAGMGGMSAGNVSMMLNQQIVQERMRQQQMQAQGGMGAGSPTHANSPMGSDPSGFSGPSAGPSMRSGSAIPGIARSTRSPSDSSGPSPMTARGGMHQPTRQEDYQRMLMQQQQGQAMRTMASQSPAFNQQIMNAAQQQMLAQQGGNFGMSPPPTAPSPTNSQQNWGTPAQSNSGGGYPFGQSPAGSDTRHLSATPAPQQASHITPPPTDHMMPSDFDMFNWNT